MSGQADCKGGKKYDPGKGHTGAFVKGYDAGWVNEGCKIPTSIWVIITHPLPFFDITIFSHLFVINTLRVSGTAIIIFLFLFY